MAVFRNLQPGKAAPGPARVTMVRSSGQHDFPDEICPSSGKVLIPPQEFFHNNTLKKHCLMLDNPRWKAHEDCIQTGRET